MQQNILDQDADDNLRVYSIWLPMLGSDDRPRVRTSLMVDPRVRHFWDGDRAIGRWLGGMEDAKRTAWDVFFLFGPDATWKEKPEPMVAHGFPIIRHVDALKSGLLRIRQGQTKNRPSKP